jgi:F-type H+-transporting ATPase subunit b
MPLADSLTTTPIWPAGSELILGTVCFVVIFGVLGKLLLPRITKLLNEREDAIQGGINRADEAQAEAQAVLAQYRAQLDDARREASRMREEAHEQGAQIIAEMRERAEAEARRITESAQAQIDADRQQALISLRAEVGTLATELASRIVGEITRGRPAIVGESLTDAARQGRMVDRFLDDLAAQDAAGNGASQSGARQ